MTKQTFQHISRGDATEANDCTVRALQAAAQIPYEQAHAALAAAGRAKGKSVSFFTADAAYRPLGGKWVCLAVLRPTLAQFTRSLPSSRCVALVRGHALAMVDGAQHDMHVNGARRRVLGYWKFD